MPQQKQTFESPSPSPIPPEGAIPVDLTVEGVIGEHTFHKPVVELSDDIHLPRKVRRQIAEVARLASEITRPGGDNRAKERDHILNSHHLKPDAVLDLTSPIVQQEVSHDVIVPGLAEDVDYTEGQQPETSSPVVASYEGEVPGIEPDLGESVQYADNHPAAEYNGPGEVPTLEPAFNPEEGVTGAMRKKIRYFNNPPNEYDR